ncbi:MAG: alanine dehydrogenase, partial [Imperialibacter sp.]
MMKTKVGIIKEGKVPIDKRVPITPDQALEIQAKFPNVEVLVQRSDVRCFADAAYEEKGLKMVDSMDMCDIIFGVKEVPMAQLIPGKTYFFFSHTIKKQEYNKPLLKALLEKKIKMVDYETLTDENGQRVIAFGRWAGIVGAYNAIWTYGKRYNLYHLRRAHECFDREDLKTEFSK